MTSISVIINHHNYALYLREAVESALDQLAEGDELIIVDDGSTDDTENVLAQFAGHPGIRILRQPNQGQLAAVLTGASAARGDLLALLDSDDRYLPGYLTRLRALAESHGDIDFFFSRAKPTGSSGTAAGTVDSIRRTLERIELPPGPTGPTRWSTIYSGEWVGAPTSGLAFRRELGEAFVARLSAMDVRAEIAPWAALMLRIPLESAAATRLPADGIIVRAASVAGVLKYYCPESAFMYRIHSTNAYAKINRLGRVYLRWLRASTLARPLQHAFAIAAPPGIDEIMTEVRARSRPIRPTQRLRQAINYSVAALRSRGDVLSKGAALFRIPRIVLGSDQPATTPRQSAPDS